MAALLSRYVRCLDGVYYAFVNVYPSYELGQELLNALNALIT